MEGLKGADIAGEGGDHGVELLGADPDGIEGGMVGNKAVAKGVNRRLGVCKQGQER
jgi:hypothetical protein